MASRRLSESSPFISHPTRPCFHEPFPLQDKAKRGEFDNCNVRLVVQGQYMHRKGKDSVGDYDDAFSPVLADSGFRTILCVCVCACV